MHNRQDFDPGSRSGLGSSVHMGHGRDHFFHGFFNVKHQDHVRRGISPIEIEMGFVLRHRGGEGTEGFPEFDPGIENILHLRIARIGQNGSVAQGPGSGLHPSVKPSNDVASGEQLAAF